MSLRIGQSTALPPLHLTDQRVHVGTLGPWQVLVWAVNDPRHQYLARKGMLHLQLLHRRTGVSLLTKSALTDGEYELSCAAGRFRGKCYGCMRKYVAEELELVAPCQRLVTEYESAFVWSRMVGVR